MSDTVANKELAAIVKGELSEKEARAALTLMNYGLAAQPAPTDFIDTGYHYDLTFEQRLGLVNRFKKVYGEENALQKRFQELQEEGGK